jgi:hypothetical protein
MPLIIAAASLSRNTIGPATSSSVAQRPGGIRAGSGRPIVCPVHHDQSYLKPWQAGPGTARHVA